MIAAALREAVTTEEGLLVTELPGMAPRPGDIADNTTDTIANGNGACRPKGPACTAWPQERGYCGCQQGALQQEGTNLLQNCKFDR